MHPPTKNNNNNHVSPPQAAQSSATHIADEKLTKVMGPFPLTERGVPSSLFAHPKEPRVIYPSGKSVVVRSLVDPSDTFVYHGHNHPVTVAKFSPSGYWVASCDETGKVRVWSWDNPEHTLKVEVAAFSGKIIDMDWDPESKRIVVVGDGKQLSAKCFMWDTGNSVGEMIGHAKRITSVSYKPSRPFRIMTGGEDFKTCWYTGPPFKIDHSNSDHTKEVWCVRFSPDGSKLASIGADRRIVFYDAKEGTKASEIVEASPGAHTGSILHCCWSPDSLKLVTCSLDKTVKVWDATSGACETTYTFGDAPTIADMQCAVAWCGEFLVALNLAGELNYLDPASPTSAVRIAVGHSAPVPTLAAASGGEFFTGGDDGRVLKWTGGIAAKVAGPDLNARTTHGGKVVGVFPGSTAIVSAGFDDKLRFADPGSLRCVSEHALEGQPQAFASAAGPQLVAVGTSNAQAVFVRDGAFAFAAALPAPPLSLALSPDGNVLAAGVGHNVHVFGVDGASGALAPIKVVEGHRGNVTSLAFSPDGANLAAGDGNREIKVWATDTWETKVSGKWVFHTAGVSCLAWSPDSQYVASGSFDQSIFLWSLAKPMKKQQIKFAHKGGVAAVAYLDDTTLASSGHDGAVVLWNATPPQ